MCYMGQPVRRKRANTVVVRETAAAGRASQKVGVRELRQNLSVYLDRVKNGEALAVCEHGMPVAILRPLPVSDSIVARLVAEGRATPASRSVRSLPRPRPATPGAPSISEILHDLRVERLP